MAPRVLYIPFPRSRHVKQEFAMPWVATKPDGSTHPLRGWTLAKSIDEKSRKKKRKSLYVLYKDEPFPENLENNWLSQRESKIYIVGHCDRGLDALYAKGNSFLQDFLPKKWRPNSVVTYKQLCAQLVAAKLPRKFPGKLVIYACSSARSTLFHKSFTHRFDAELRQSGFLRCSIFGYLNSLSRGYAAFQDPTDPTKQIAHHGAAPRFLGKLRGKDTDNDYWKYRAKQRRVKFRPPESDASVGGDHHFARVVVHGRIDNDEAEEIAAEASALSDEVLAALDGTDVESDADNHGH